MSNESNMPPREATISPLRGPVRATVAIPGSKSLANRVILLAGMAGGDSRLDGIPDGDDSQSALAALRGLGIGVDELGGGAYLVHGCGHDIPRREAELDIRSAGTVGRFLPGLLASAGRGRWRLSATAQLSRRPLGPLVTALRAWGADIASESADAAFPLMVKGGELAGGEVGISAAKSTQFASGLLLAAPYARRDAVVRIRDWNEEDRYVAATLNVMRHFGVDSESCRDGGSLVVRVAAGGGYRAAAYRVEGDLNAALNFLVIPLLVGGEVAVTGVPLDTAQSGREMLGLIERLGGRVTGDDGEIRVSASGGVLPGGFTIDMRALSEMALTLGVLAVFADGPVTMTNLGHIRNHETDRLAAIAELLGEAGVRVERGADWVRVEPLARERLRVARIDSRDDHRVVMAFSLLGLAGRGIAIDNADAVSKTFPGFFAALAAVVDGGEA